MPKRAAQLPDHPDCLNCGARLRGQYCGDCGQRATSRLISLWELLRDGFGDLLDLDSRLWQTLKPLLIRPGLLTLDYLQGRRARYMPPFRMYLVLSVVFFIVAFFDPRDDLSLLFEPEPPPTAEEQRKEEAGEEALEKLDELDSDDPDNLEDLERLDRLVERGYMSAEQVEDIKERARENPGPNVTLYGDGDEGLNFQYDDDTGECTVTGLEKLPAWFQRRLTEERLVGVCERVGADGGKTFVDLLLDNIPVALIVLLPFMALVLKALYPLSRRYFVEHLLFFVHYHSFFFLILTLQILFERLAGLVFVPEPITILVLVAASFYVPVYLYKAMRRVYGQGHFFTLLKYLIMVTAYLAGVMVTMFGAMLFALFSV